MKSFKAAKIMFYSSFILLGAILITLVGTTLAYFTVTRHFRIGRLESVLGSLRPTDYYESLALARAGAEFAGAEGYLDSPTVGLPTGVQALVVFQASVEPLPRFHV